MSILIDGARPVVEFDPTNGQHRKWYSEFQFHRSWSDCPVKFIVTGEQGIPHGIMQRKLLEYYLSTEFAV